uniref:Reverse transcriptase domain-containing protein n=1 Tax=Graphocephala atropunctata TaxID=36148 RepID=A0A1B6LII1_9HEMI
MTQAFQVITNALLTFPHEQNITILLGDTNIDDLTLTSGRTRFTEFLTSYDIKRLQLPPTRITKDTSTSIDAVCINSNNLEDIEVEVLKTGISDHTGQLCQLKLTEKVKLNTTSVRRHLNKNNLAEFKTLLAAESWECVLTCEEVEEAYNNFILKVTTALDLTCPNKKSRNNKNLKKAVFCDKEARNLKISFLEAEDMYKISGQEEDKQQAAIRKKTYDLKLKSLRKRHNTEYINKSENKPKAIWDTINSERRRNKQQDSGLHNLKIDGQIVTDPTAVANHFNEYFSNAAENMLSKNSQTTVNSARTLSDIQVPLTCFSTTSTNEIRKIINSLKPKSSAGLDEMSSNIVIYCCEEFIVPLQHIINLSFQSGEFPTKLKIAKIHPLHKKGSKNEVENFRPISLISTFSKILEKLALSRLFNHLDNNHLLTNHQHGFLQKRSTVTAIVDLVEHITDNLEDRESTVSIFLDLSKAFDSLSHGLILDKLHNLGIQNTALKWFSKYIQGRYQLVEISQSINGQKTKIRSGLQPIRRGVPQGSVLGPVLFILFTNDLPSYLDPYSYTIMYADDSVLLTSSKSFETLEINSFIALNLATQYCEKNDLVFNQSKTNHIIFGNRQCNTSIFPQLQLASSTKYLGVTIDDKLSWKSHIDVLCSKLSSTLFALRRIKAVCTPEAMTIAYHSLFESHIRYAIVAWGGSSHSNLERVLIVQKKALRIMTGVDWCTSCRPIFKELRLLTVTNLYILETILFAINKNLTRNMDLHGYSTRNGNNFSLPLHRLSLYEKKPSYAGAKLFNNLPPELKSQADLKSVKKHLTKWLQEKPFYTIEEFLDWQNFHD